MDDQVQQFITKYTGIPDIGDTPENRGQCVGLAEVWLDTLGLNTPHLYGNAKDLLTNADPNKFAVIYNTPDNFPVPGDVPVWDATWGNGKGHTGIVVTADRNSTSIFQQNDPTGSTPHVKTYSYTGVIGWLHPKQPPASVLPPNYDDIIRKSSNWDSVTALGFTSVDQLKGKLATDQQTITDLAAARDTKDQLYQAEVQKNTELEGQVKKLTNDNTTLTQQTADAKDQSAHILSDYQTATQADSQAINAGLAAEQQLKDLQSGLAMLAEELHCVSTIDSIDRAIQVKQQESAVQVKQQKQIYDFFTGYIQLLIAKFIQKR